MNSLRFPGSESERLLADVNAMGDFLGMLHTPEVDAIRPQLDAKLEWARHLLLADAARVRARAIGTQLLLAATVAAAGAVTLTWLLRARRSGS